MSRKIKKVTLLKDIGLPESYTVKAGTVGEVNNNKSYYWRFYNEKAKYYSYSEDDLQEYSEWFKIEYETPKIKSVALKMGKVTDSLFVAELRGGCDIDFILSNPEKFIIEYEEDSE
mgnify:CR=1 FL=1